MPRIRSPAQEEEEEDGDDGDEEDEEGEDRVVKDRNGHGNGVSVDCRVNTSISSGTAGMGI
jgi:hypothetical protein